MAENRIRFEVDGMAEFDRVFIRLGARFDDLTPIWPDLRDEFWKTEKEQFRSEGSAGSSGKWKPLSKAYAARKLKQYGAKPILERTGRLMKSLTGETGDTVYQPTKSELAIGTSVPYARHHQRGGGRLPQRKPISLSETQRRRMQLAIQRGMVRELRRGNVYVEEG